jgi:simple sugar transport system permease protein
MLSLLFGLALSLLLVYWMGDRPLSVLQVLLESSLGSREDILLTLSYATPLIFTGLAVGVAFRAGLFNIGAEGQLLWGALSVVFLSKAITVLSSHFGLVLPHGVLLLLGFMVTALAGGLWGGLVGYFKTRFEVHEVVSGMMLNFIANAMTSFVVLSFFKTQENQNPETFEILPGLYFEHAFLFAVLMALILEFVFQKTLFGFQLKAVGQNPEAAQSSGISVSKIRLQAMLLSGALAGFVGIHEVMGLTHKFKVGFTSGEGFIGIAVALLARNRPIVMIFTALLFAALHKGAIDLDLETDKITRELALVIQAVMILVFSFKTFPKNPLSSWFKKRRHS